MSECHEIERYLGGRYVLATVSGTDIPVAAYFEDVIAPVTGRFFARPVIRTRGGRFRSICYRPVENSGEELIFTGVVKGPVKRNSSWEADLRQLETRLAEAVSAARDPSVRAVLESVELPDRDLFPEAYRTVRSAGRGSEPRLTIVDWGLRQEGSPLKQRARPVPTGRPLRKRFLLWVGLVILMIFAGVIFVVW